MQRRRKPFCNAKPKASKVRFLRKNPQLWTESERVIVQALKAAGLVARSTYYTRCNVRSLLKEAQAEPTKRRVRPRCPMCGHVLPGTMEQTTIKPK
jgi:hypothetical protein